MDKLIKNKYIWIFVTFLLIFEILPPGINLFLYLLGVGNTEAIPFRDYHIDNPMLILVLNVLHQLIILGFIGFLYYKTSLFQWRKPNFRGKDFLYATFVFFGGKVGTIIGAVIIGLLLGLNIEETPANQRGLDKFVLTSYLSIIHIIILAPIIEEFFFRKILIGHIFFKYKYMGLLISSLSFGAMHMFAGFTVLGMILYSCLGFFLGLVYIRTNRLETPILAHSFNNLISYLMVLITR